MTTVIVVLVGVLGALSLWVFSVFGSALSRLIADDVKAWTPSLTRHLIKRAVRILPEQQEDYAKKWSDHLDKTPGDLSKIITSITFLCTADRIKPQQVRSIQSALRNASAFIDMYVKNLYTIIPLSSRINTLEEQIRHVSNIFVFNEDFCLAFAIVSEINQKVRGASIKQSECAISLLEAKNNLDYALHDKRNSLKIEILKETLSVLTSVGVVVRSATSEMQVFLNDANFIQKCITNGVSLRPLEKPG